MKRVALSLAVLLLAACSDPSAPPSPASPRADLAGAEPRQRYIVTLHEGGGSAGDVANDVGGGAVVDVFSQALNGFVADLSEADAAAVAADPRVAAIELDGIMSIDATQTGATWGIDRIDQRTLPLSTTYTYSATGAGVDVYIIDTGIRFTHSQFGGRAVKGVDKVTTNGTAADCNGHGTHVAGTVGGSTYGVAKGVRLIAVRVLGCSGSGYTSGVIAGIDWVTQQRQANPSRPAVANMSLGGSLSSALNQAVQSSIAAGVSYAVAAGNSGANACNYSPASAPNALTVAATSSTDQFAGYSNRGSCVDLLAPGANITSAWHSGDNATNTISGTSMASPHVAGAAALLLQGSPSATPAAIASQLKSNATMGVVRSVPTGTSNALLYVAAGATSSAPVAAFTSTCARLTCTFDGRSSQNAVSYAWTFSDGGTATGSTATHTFPASAYWWITLTVTNSTGQTHSVSKYVKCMKRNCS